MEMGLLLNFEQEMKQRSDDINVLLLKHLPLATGEQKTLLEAIRYSMLAGGKRLRPMLMQETCRLFGGESQALGYFMAAMEMIHTHSLIHDDLPAMDNDEYRRGKKTTHVVFGEAMAILAGDGLLNFAYETASDAFLTKDSPYRISWAFRVLTKKTGIYGMIGGQSVDVEFEGQPLSEGQLDFIYELKTSALIEASMMIGAILGGASEEEVHQIELIGRRVGLAFQIQDDILDVIGDEALLGKPVNSDEKNNKTTYVTIKGLEQAAADAERISREAIALLDELEGKNEFLRELLLHLINRKA